MEKTMKLRKASSSSSTWAQMKKWKISYVFILPFLLIFCMFTVAPILMSLFLSLTSFDMIQMPKFIGLENYIRMFFEDDIFLIAIKNTLILALITGPVGYLLSLIFAWFINELRPITRSVVTLIFYAPSISGNMYLIWKVMFSGDAYGYANGFLMKLGLIGEPILWLKDTKYMMGIVIVVALWSSLGTSFLAFIAGFQGVDKSYYEAAAVDGITNRWQELWFVTLPLMRPQMMFGAVMSITSSFGIGAMINQLIDFPSVDYAVHTMQNHLDDYGGMKYEMGYASAIATVLFVMMFVTNIAVKKLIAKVGE